jgi:imidazolonepropionase-like amidohydrolase
MENGVYEVRRRPWLRALAWLAAALSLQSCASVPRAGDGQSRTLIRNVTVIPMDRPGSVPRQDVVISNGRIVAIAGSGLVRARASDHVIDGAGKYLMPGLWDMHAHALLGGAEPAREALSLYLANGVVGVRDLGSTLEDLADARAKLPIGTELPHLVASGPLLDGPRQPWQQKMALALGTVQEARAAAERLGDAGVDFLKIYNNLSPEQFAAVTQVAKARGLAMAGHVPFKLSLEQVSAAGMKSIEHAGLQLVKDCIPGGEKAIPAVLGAWIKDGYSGRYEETGRWWAKREPAACRALYARMAQRRTWATPTLTNEIQGGRWTGDADLALLPADRLAACRSNLQSVDGSPASRDAANRDVFNLVRDLHAAGVPLLAGTDTPNSCLAYGSSLHKELEMLRHAGLSPWEVLKTATINPARFLGRKDEGVVRAGAAANLLLLDADPLADVANTRRIAGVMLAGRWHDGAALAGVRSTGAGEAAAKIYDNAWVWTGSGFERRTLAVRGGLFVKPASATGGERIDLGGGFVVPAYGNAHAHVTTASAGASWNFLKNGVFYVWNPNTIVASDADRAFFARPDTFDVAVAQGGITEPGGHPEKLYVDILTRYVYKGKTLDYFLGNAFHYGRDVGEIDRALDLLKSQKADFVKAYLLHSEDYASRRDDPLFYGRKGLNPANFAHLVGAARRRGLPVVVHVETAADLKVAALSGSAVAGHLPAYWGGDTDADLAGKALTAADAATVARSGMLLVPTYALAAGHFADAEKAGKLDRELQARAYAMQAANLKLLKRAGARFLMGTDTAGQIFDEAEHLVAIGGLSTGEALRIVLETGKQLFPTRRIGCFEVGCEADFLLLAADPSRDIAALRKIVKMVKAGTELQPPAADPAPAT